MPRDLRSQEIKKGDYVMIPAIVTEVTGSGEYGVNLTVSPRVEAHMAFDSVSRDGTVTTRTNPKPIPMSFHLNSHQCYLDMDHPNLRTIDEGGGKIEIH